MQRQFLRLSILGVEFPVSGLPDRLHELVVQNFSAYVKPSVNARAFFNLRKLPDGRLTLESIRSGILWESGTNSYQEADDYLFLYALEKELTLELQRARSDLYFVHAAVLERAGRCMLIAAESGTGKSTTAFALQSYGYRYMSDELAPIHVDPCAVYPYRHALCLKNRPPEPFAKLPLHFATERTLHIPVSQLVAVNSDNPVTLGALIFLQRRGASGSATLVSISPAEAAVRLYGNTLNALAHPNAGLDAAAALTERIPAWQLNAGPLADTCKLLEQLDL